MDRYGEIDVALNSFLEKVKQNLRQLEFMQRCLKDMKESKSPGLFLICLDRLGSL